jgi:glycosyltransferase involved in cell wall biosynthesis
VASLAGRYAAVRKSFLLVEPILDCSLGAVVYNQFSQQDLLARRPHADIRCLRYHFYLPGGFPEQVDVQALRQRWRVDSRFVIGTFGLFTTADKRIDVCLRVFKRFLDFMPDARYLLVGSYSAQYDVPAMVRAYGLEERVVVTGWMDALQFAQHLCVPDIAIHLRYPHIGGTLYTPIRLLGLGIPTILSDIGPLQEFPEGCCAKILPDEYEEETLLKTLCYLAERNDFRQQMGENGRQFIQQHHNVNQVACEHLDFFRQVASSPVGTTRAQMPGVWEGHLIRQCAGALARWGVEETEDMMLTPIAEAIARTVREKPSCGVL